jgi:outer membrane lipoprotein-sorting protein
MRKPVLVIASILVSALFVTSGFALEFSSDMVMTSQGQVHTSKIYMKDQKSRTESEIQPSYNIMRMDKNVMWMVMPDQKTYMEMKYDPSKAPKTGERLQGEASRKLIGSERIDGHPTQKYEITYAERGKTDRMHQWVATDINFPVKMAAVDGSWTVEYKNIKMGTQPDTLFEVPSGYQKVAMPGPGNFAVGAASGRPEVAATEEPREAANQGSEEGTSKGSGGLLDKLPKIKLPKW